MQLHGENLSQTASKKIKKNPLKSEKENSLVIMLSTLVNVYAHGEKKVAACSQK